MLTGLSSEARRRFAGHLRPWSAETNDFAPAAPDDATELVSGDWCLPVVFLGRFNPDQDDFEGNTFFAYPQRPEGDFDPAEVFFTTAWVKGVAFTQYERQPVISGAIVDLGQR